MTWKEKARPAIENALGRTDFVIVDGKVVGDGVPDDKELHRIVGASMQHEMGERSRVRHEQVSKRGAVIQEKFKDAFKLSSAVIVQGMLRFGGNFGPEITARCPELLPWGQWEQQMKKAIDAGEHALLPLPPLPSWLEVKPGLKKLCDELGVKA